MYLLIVSYKAEPDEYFGPFPAEKRAKDYGIAYKREHHDVGQFKVIPLVVPYAVVQQIIWRTV